eukprot:CAMPEP_0194276016 /NCGR_PEP_ID=MMETSP0169-20130528/8711_1 /TAXON_ID=218684 /ORGANISM="Corethron pennatum, Strain L29A3" /LENGTH=276 /DNA_ID=CAMNT_0039019631 /DNA_START=51 /DNA_END=881 /DNA_ORIENTATION=+
MAQVADILSRSTLSIWTGLCGIAGAALMLVADVLLYGPDCHGQSASVYFDSVDPSTKDPFSLLTSPMASSGHATAAGIIGPVSGLLYVIGGAGVLLRPEHGASGVAAALGHCLATIGAACYHTAFVYTAFIAAAYQAICPDDVRTADCGGGFGNLVASHAAYMGHLKRIIVLGGVVSTAGLFALCASHRASAARRSAGASLLPWWVILVAPAPWLLAVRETGLLRALPAPYGLVVAGGSFNICFFVFFLVVTVRAVKVYAENSPPYKRGRKHDKDT